MSPEDRQLLQSLKERLDKLERAENVAFIKSIERNTDFITLSELQNTLDALTLNDLADVDTSGVTNGQVIKYDSGTWENANDIDT